MDSSTSKKERDKLNKGDADDREAEVMNGEYDTEGGKSMSGDIMRAGVTMWDPTELIQGCVEMDESLEIHENSNVSNQDLNSARSGFVGIPPRARLSFPLWSRGILGSGFPCI